RHKDARSSLLHVASADVIAARLDVDDRAREALLLREVRPGSVGGPRLSGWLLAGRIDSFLADFPVRLVEDRDCEAALFVGDVPELKHRRQFLAVLDRFVVILEAQFKLVKDAYGVFDIEIVRFQRHHPTEPSNRRGWFPRPPGIGAARANA